MANNATPDVLSFVTDAAGGTSVPFSTGALPSGIPTLHATGWSISPHDGVTSYTNGGTGGVAGFIAFLDTNSQVAGCAMFYDGTNTWVGYAGGSLGQHTTVVELVGVQALGLRNSQFPLAGFVSLL